MASARPPVEGARYFIKRLDQGESLDDLPDEFWNKLKYHPGVEKALIDARKEDDKGFSALRLVTDRHMGGKLASDYIIVKGGRDFPRHYHNYCTAFFYITEGRGTFYLDGDVFPIEAGDCVLVKPGSVHEITAIGGTLAYLVTETPDLLQADQDGYFDLVLA